MKRTLLPATVLSLAVVFFCVFPTRAAEGSGDADVRKSLLLLRTGGKGEKITALAALGGEGAGAREAVPSVLGALADSDAVLRRHAAETLGMIGEFSPEVVGGLIMRLDDPDPGVIGAAAGALALSGSRGAGMLAQVLTGDTSASHRRGAVIALTRMGAAAREEVPALTSALRDPDDYVRYTAAIALGNSGARAIPSVSALIPVLGDRDEDVRREAAVAVAKLVPDAPRPLVGERTVPAVIDSLVPALMKELHVPGVSVTLMRGGGVAWRGEYGVADVRRQIRVTDSTMFEACSMSKPVFAALVLLLAREGKIDLDRPLSRYLDERELFSQMSYKLITARMVLSHTSGLPNWRKGDEEWGGPLPIMFSPGSAFLYSGEGYYYLQRVVEKITGEALEHCAARMLFRPLGMRHASYVWTDGVEGTLASGHTVGGQFKERTHYRRANAAYTLYVSAADYGRFLAEFLRRPDDPGRLFPASLVDSMFATRVRVVVRDPIERPGKARGTGVFWCLGWSVNTSEEGEIAHHSGSNGSGFRCFSQFDRGRGTGLVIMTNSAGGGDLWTRLVGVVGDW